MESRALASHHVDDARENTFSSKSVAVTPRVANVTGLLPSEPEYVVATVRRDLLLFELSQVVHRLHESSLPEPICGRLVRKFEPMVEAGLVSVAYPAKPGEPITVTRLSPPRILVHYFWSTWLPAYYKQLEKLAAPAADREVSCCTVVLAFPEKNVSLNDVMLDLSLRLEVNGVAEITHIEGGDAALHQEYVDVEVKP